MKTVIIALVSLVVTASILTTDASASETLQGNTKPCVTSKCIVEALSGHTGSQIIISGSDYGSQGHNVYMASTEGVVVSGPDYGPNLSDRPTYSA